MIIALCGSWARADTTAPSPAAGELPPLPLISDDAIAIYNHAAIGDAADVLTEHMVFLHIEPPFAQFEVTDKLARSRALIATHHLKPFPVKVASEPFAWGHRRMFDLKVDAGGLRFRVHKNLLTVERAGKTLVREQLSTPGVSCYELTPYVVEIWLDPARGIVAIRTWGDKCMGPSFEWELISLLAPTKTLRENLLHDL